MNPTPSRQGSILYYTPPNVQEITSAEFNLIDDANTTTNLKPQAYSATVQNGQDARRINTPVAGWSIAASVQAAFGLFLSSENSKGAFMHQVKGYANLLIEGSGFDQISARYFFGRRATSDTVVASLAAADNQLEHWILLPTKSDSSHINVTGSRLPLRLSCDEIIYTPKDTGDFVYCFGIQIYNHSASTATIKGSISLDYRKDTDSLVCYHPKLG